MSMQTVARNEEEKLGKEVHRKFRSGVRSLLHLLKHLRGELSNLIRELSGCVAGPTEENVCGENAWSHQVGSR